MSTIDLVTQGADGTVFLVLRHESGDATVDQLQQRVHDCLSYALDGQLTAAYPTVAGQPVSIRVDVPVEPTGDLASYLAAVRPRIAGYGVGLIVSVVP